MFTNKPAVQAKHFFLFNDTLASESKHNLQQSVDRIRKRCFHNTSEVCNPGPQDPDYCWGSGVTGS